ncbi:MAG: TolC family protein [Luteolibacter sp.]
MKFHILLLSGTLVSTCFAQAEKPERINTTWLARLRAEAAAHHPAATASRERARASAAETRSVYLWDDPMVGMSLMAADEMMRRDEGDVRLMIEQAFPKPGVYQATRAKAAAMRRAGEHQSRATALETGAAAARLAIELALADEAILLQQQQLDWLREMETNARQRALNPGSSSSEPLRFSAELLKETEMLNAAKRTREGISQRLNVVLGRKPAATWPGLRLPERSLPIPIARAEIARIPRSNPQVLAMKSMKDAAHEEVRLADRERQPGFAITTGTNVYSGGDFRSAEVGVKLNLPWFNDKSYQAKIDAAAHREAAAAADIETMLREIEGQVVSSIAEAANAAAQADAYAGEIDSRTRLAADSIQSSWITSTATLNELLESRRLLFSIRLDQRRFIAMQLAALEDLNLLVPRK